MRRIWAILIVIAFLYFFFKDVLPALPEFGKVDLFTRVSFDIISKSTKGKYEPIEFKKSSNREEGSANVVTSIVVNYRSFDTLGEVTVLFTAAIGVGILSSALRKRRFIEFEEHFVLKITSGIILPLVLLFGTYIFIHGHLTPGGGFPGGTVIALGILLMLISNNQFRVTEASKHVEQISGVGYVILGLIGMALSGIFLTNFLPTGVIGDLFSAGVVPIVYVLIGFKVGAELSSIVFEMKEG
ncbi:MAG: Na(+)/H(+) antiporter subunit B [Fervidobacterium sp.]|nr:Na(+)/H(+) antiporter subunit B [Fervidobacterium sp.]